MDANEAACNRAPVPGIADMETAAREALHVLESDYTHGMQFSADEGQSFLNLLLARELRFLTDDRRVNFEVDGEREILERHFRGQRFTIYSDGLQRGTRRGAQLASTDRRFRDAVGNVVEEVEAAPLSPHQDSRDGAKVARLVGYSIARSDGDALPTEVALSIFASLHIETVLGIVVDSYGDSLGHAMRERKIDGAWLGSLRAGKVNRGVLEQMQNALMRLKHPGNASGSIGPPSTEHTDPANEPIDERQLSCCAAEVLTALREQTKPVSLAEVIELSGYSRTPVKRALKVLRARFGVKWGEQGFYLSTVDPR